MTKIKRVSCRAAAVVMLASFLPALLAGQSRFSGLRQTASSKQARMASSRNDPAVNVSPGAWSQLGQLVPTTSNGFYAVGSSIGIDGDTIVVGSLPGFNQENAAAYIFTKPANGWSNLHSVASLVVPSTAGWLSSVAIQGDTIVVGDSDGYYGPGTTYVFVKPAGGWTDMLPTATLSASDSMPDDYFGGAVAINGNTIVVGAEGAGNYAGAAYVYIKPKGGWADSTETAKLTSTDGQTYDFMGEAVAISGKTIVVGAGQKDPAPGKAYVFVEPAGGWASTTQTAELSDSNGYDGFGVSVSVDADTILIGASDEYTGTGTAYIFSEPAGGWRNMTQSAQLSAAGGTYDFGAPVVLSGKTAVVAAPLRSYGPNIEEGGAYIFSEPAGGWKNMASSTVLTGSDVRHFGRFGSALALSANTLAAGAEQIISGSAYVFGLP
jgi:hypothetical protein